MYINKGGGERKREVRWWLVHRSGGTGLAPAQSSCLRKRRSVLGDAKILGGTLPFSSPYYRFRAMPPQVKVNPLLGRQTWHGWLSRDWHWWRGQYYLQKCHQLGPSYCVKVRWSIRSLAAATLFSTLINLIPLTSLLLMQTCKLHVKAQSFRVFHTSWKHIGWFIWFFSGSKFVMYIPSYKQLKRQAPPTNAFPGDPQPRARLSLQAATVFPLRWMRQGRGSVL